MFNVFKAGQFLKCVWEVSHIATNSQRISDFSALRSISASFSSLFLCFLYHFGFIQQNKTEKKHNEPAQGYEPCTKTQFGNLGLNLVEHLAGDYIIRKIFSLYGSSLLSYHCITM